MELIIKNQYKIQNLVQSMSLTEALDGIAYTVNIKLTNTDELKAIKIIKGDKIKLIDVSADTNRLIVVFDGVVWEKRTSKKDKVLDLICKDRTVYIEESEDEFLFGEGTATQRIKEYCRVWNIPCAKLVDTKVILSKTKCRRESIFSMMQKDLKETAQKDGDLYKVRMWDKLNIIKLGSNAVVWKLESIAEDITETSSLSGAITQVKVLGKNDKDESKSPIIGVFKKGTEFGTLQKIVQDEKVQNYANAQKRANSLFNNGEESISVTCSKDINTIRAGDVVSLDGTRYYVIDVSHNLDQGGDMTLNLGKWDYVKRRFYGDNF